MSMDINKKPAVEVDEAMGKIDKPKKEVGSCDCGRTGGVIITIFVIILLAAIAGYLVDKYTSISLFGDSANRSANYMTNYQAVFLPNGQVYFGKIASRGRAETVLTDIYYLQVSNPLQQQPPTENAEQAQLSLVKLGNELHGPMDRMAINNDHILFIEELKEDGRVVQAINNYVAGGNQ